MDLTSLAWRTDVGLLERVGSEIDDRGDHLVVRTPTNPTYYWGNFLLLARPPTAAEVPGWLEAFEEAFPDAAHRAIGVDGAGGTAADLEPLASAGFSTTASSVLTAESVHLPPRPNTAAELRPLASDDDWAQQVALSVDGEPEQHHDFETRRVALERRLVVAGRARWWGAFLDGRLVSSMGLVEAWPGLARYQEVKTLRSARGQGLAGTLVHTAGTWALEELGVRTLVMVADPDDVAIRVYRSVGFADTEAQLQATLAP